MRVNSLFFFVALKTYSIMKTETSIKNRGEITMILVLLLLLVIVAYSKGSKMISDMKDTIIDSYSKKED